MKLLRTRSPLVGNESFDPDTGEMAVGNDPAPFSPPNRAQRRSMFRAFRAVRREAARARPAPEDKRPLHLRSPQPGMRRARA